MAIVNIIFNCGCGVTAKTIEEAIRHSDEHGHTLTASGTVRSTERKVRKAVASSLAPVSSHQRVRAPKEPAAAPPTYQEEIDAGFKELRARLQRK